MFDPIYFCLIISLIFETQSNYQLKGSFFVVVVKSQIMFSITGEEFHPIVYSWCKRTVFFSK